MKIQRGQNLRTRYAYTRQNAKTLTAMLELAAKRLRALAALEHGGMAVSAHRAELGAEAVEFAAECDRIVKDCGIQERRRW